MSNSNDNVSSERQSLIRLDCAACEASWHLRASVPEDGSLGKLTGEEEIEHSLLARCNGTVTCTVVGDYPEEAAAHLRRLEADGERYERFCSEERGRIRSQALLLDLSRDCMAAVLFAQHEARLEREARGAPPVRLIGFGSTLVYGISSVNISAQSQVVVRPLRLEIPPEVARDFFLTDLKVGKNSQFVSPGAIPMSAFNDNRYHRLKVQMDVAQIAQFITVSVTNQNPAARNFQGVIVCQDIAAEIKMRGAR